jgi:hypothetical protein
MPGFVGRFRELDTRRKIVAVVEAMLAGVASFLVTAFSMLVALFGRE